MMLLEVLLSPLGTLWLLLLLLPREGSLHNGLIPCNACACCEGPTVREKPIAVRVCRRVRDPATSRAACLRVVVWLETNLETDQQREGEGALRKNLCRTVSRECMRITLI